MDVTEKAAIAHCKKAKAAFFYVRKIVDVRMGETRMCAANTANASNTAGTEKRPEANNTNNRPIGFDNEKYLKTQSAQFGDKLYLEMGGKLFDDYHASRVLPGFAPDSKVKMLLQLADQVEIVVVINATDIEKNKVRGDLGITYDADVLRLIDAFRGIGLYVGSVVIAQYSGQASVAVFKNRLNQLGIKAYLHYPIAQKRICRNQPAPGGGHRPRPRQRQNGHLPVAAVS